VEVNQTGLCRIGAVTNAMNGGKKIQSDVRGKDTRQKRSDFLEEIIEMKMKSSQIFLATV
jgi:hypothetical protein